MSAFSHQVLFSVKVNNQIVILLSCVWNKRVKTSLGLVRLIWVSWNSDWTFHYLRFCYLPLVVNIETRIWIYTCINRNLQCDWCGHHSDKKGHSVWFSYNTCTCTSKNSYRAVVMVELVYCRMIHTTLCECMYLSCSVQKMMFIKAYLSQARHELCQFQETVCLSDSVSWIQRG